MNTTDKISAFLGGEDRHSANNHITNIQKYRLLVVICRIVFRGSVQSG